jgi:type II secretory pathway pseudopilin PulG
MTTSRDEIGNDRGFTLIEATASLFILSLVLFLAFQTFGLVFRSAATIHAVAARTEAISDMRDVVGRIVLRAHIPNASDQTDKSEIVGTAQRLILSGPAPVESVTPGTYRMTLSLLRHGNDLDLMLESTLRSMNEAASFPISIAHFRNVDHAAFGYLPAEPHSQFRSRWPFGAGPLAAVQIIIGYRDGSRSVQAIFPTARGI